MKQLKQCIIAEENAVKIFYLFVCNCSPVFINNDKYEETIGVLPAEGGEDSNCFLILRHYFYS